MKHSHTTHRIRVLYATVALGAVGVAHAATPISDGGRLYAPCVLCHQASAWGSTDGVIPNLAGQQKRYLERRLAVLRYGARYDTAMPIAAVHSKFSDPRNIVAVANYLSGLEANPRPVTGSGNYLRVGEELYVQICAACHGDGGQGQASNRVPRIGGQHYPYLRQQIEQASDLHRELAPPEMTGALRSMRSTEKDALADYISRLSRADSLVESHRLE